ncbi:MAG: hypothetical protein AUK44_02695 [Porphyromonadaceae bacterium CG2_30_38_12]|nr:MAG: hypothetical protein AUK44_02695 [Porphyromonadaceae bacterium CG2_30_38_12]
MEQSFSWLQVKGNLIFETIVKSSNYRSRNLGGLKINVLTPFALSLIPLASITEETNRTLFLFMPTILVMLI